MPSDFYQQASQFAFVPRLGGYLCLGRVFMSREGGFVLGGWFWRICCLVMCLHLTFSPSKDLEDTEI